MNSLGPLKSDLSRLSVALNLGFQPEVFSSFLTFRYFYSKSLNDPFLSFTINTVVSPNSHIFVRPKKRWLFGYVWQFGYYVTIWVPRGFRIKSIDSSIRIRFLFVIREIFSDWKNCFRSLQNFRKQRVMTDFSNDWKKSSILFFWNPSLTQIVTFARGQKGCDYLGMCVYSGVTIWIHNSIYSKS